MHRKFILHWAESIVTETAALDALQAHARLLLDAHRLWRLPEH